MLQGFIAFLQPIIALMFIICGAAMLLWTWLGWMLTSTAPFKAWAGFAINHASAIALVLTGFFIAHW